MVPSPPGTDAATEFDLLAGGAFLHRDRPMTRDERKRRNRISLLIDMRDRCEDISEKMEAKQSRWLEREIVFPFRSSIQLSKARRGVSHPPV
jgi:hypothetical protein